VGLRLPAHPLIELIDGDGFDHGNQSDFALIGVLLPVRWTSGGGNRRGLDGFTQMHEASSPGGAGNLPSMRTTDEDLLSIVVGGQRVNNSGPSDQRYACNIAPQSCTLLGWPLIRSG